MGKTTIVGGGDKGNYTIKMDYGTATRDATVEKIAQHLTELETKITEAQPKLDAAKAAEAEKKTAAQKTTNDYIAATQAIPPAFEAVSSAMDAVENLAASATATPEERKAAQDALTAAEAAYTAAQNAAKEALSEQTKAATALVEAKKKTAPLQLPLDALVDEQKKLQKDKAYWEGLQLESTLQAWCADYTENGRGEVATMEIPGENQIVLIKPGAPAGNTVDGKLVAREVQSPEQVFFNAAILPGWQKFKPTYRTGVITALYSDDTADVKLDDAKSSAQNLGINQKSTLLSVPVTYMDCNAAAFEVDDKCVIRFDAQNWDAPRVVGFVDHPKPCNWPCVFASPYWYAYTFQNTLAEKNPVSMQELLGLSIGVQVRVNRGPWVNLEFIQTISASGGRYYNQWREPGAPGTPRAQLYVGRNFYLSQTNDLSAPAVDGITLYPRGFSGVAAQADIPMVYEFRVSIGGKVKFAAAIYSNNGSDYYAPSSGKVRAPGGIKLSSDSMPVTALNYQLDDTEP